MSEALFGLLGVVVGAAITWVKDWWSEGRNRRRHATYLATRMVCIFDSYVESCAEVVADDGLIDGHRNPDGCLEIQVEEPDPPAYPEDLEWTSIPHAIAYRALSLPDRVSAARRQIGFRADFDGPPYDEAIKERQIQYAELGLLAAEIAEELRNEYRIPTRNYGDFNTKSWLKEKTRELRQRP